MRPERPANVPPTARLVGEVWTCDDECECSVARIGWAWPAVPHLPHMRWLSPIVWEGPWHSGEPLAIAEDELRAKATELGADVDA